ncbi:MAG: hypothetical protein AABW67_03370 [Nanoarchaeota archaeon]
MKSDKRVGKRVVLGIFILGIVLVSIVSINAGWKDLFTFGNDNKDLEGELAESATAKLTVSGSAPTIVSWLKPDEDTITGTGGDGFTPVPGTGVDIVDNAGTNKLGIRVLITDPDGCADLTDGNAVVKAYISKSGVNRPGPAITDKVTCTTTQIPSTCTPNVLFICPAISMKYWDVAASDWIINVDVDDGSGKTDTKLSTAVLGNYPYLIYNTANGILLADSDDVGIDADMVGGLGKDTISFPGVTSTSINLNSNPDLNVYNNGNVEYSSAKPGKIKIKGANLVQAIAGADAIIDAIDVSSFAVDETDSACVQADKVTLTIADQNILNANLPVQIADRTFGLATQREELFFCLTQVNRPAGQTTDPIDAGDYSSSAWAVTACASSC